MQTVSGRGFPELSPQSRRIAIIAVLLFGFSGLVSGFAVGGFVRPHIGGNPTSSSNNGTLPGQSSRTPSTTKTAVENIALDQPIINSGDFKYRETANGTTSYAYSAQIVYLGTTTPIHVSDVTCKLWLTRDLQGTGTYLNANGYAVQKNISQIAQPFALEVLNALNFVAPSRQTQPCTPNGKTTWNYTISPSLAAGTYYVFVLADWQGKSFNWYARAIDIRKQGG